MMTSTYPSSKSSFSGRFNATTSTKFPIPNKDIQSKKESLKKLEATLKERISELRELCLKEGELTGQLPIDYPLQPREPIPQVRRRATHHHRSISNNSHISSNLKDNLTILPPGSIKSSRDQTMPYFSNHQPIKSQSQQFTNVTPISTSSSSSFSSSSSKNNNSNNIIHTNLPFPSRPTSTNSTSSSNSTASLNTKTNGSYVLNNNMNFNSNSHNIINGFHKPKMNLQQQQQQQYTVNNFQPYYEETKPFQMSDFYKYSSKYRAKSYVDDQQLHNNQQSMPPPPPPLVQEHQTKFRTTRQMQEDVMRKNPLRFSACDDQIQASVKLIEKSGQKLIEATAKAIAGNPGLAEKLSNILPTSNGERY